MDLRNPKPFVWLDAVLADDRLIPSDKVIATALFRFAPKEPPLTCWASEQAIQDRVGLCRGVVTKANKKLVSLGYQESERRPNQSTVRRLVLPDPVAHGGAHPKSNGSVPACSTEPIRLRTVVRPVAHAVAHPSTVNAPINSPEEEDARCAAASSSSDRKRGEEAEGVRDWLLAKFPSIKSQLDDALDTPDLTLDRAKELVEEAKAEFNEKPTKAKRDNVVGFVIQKFNGWAEGYEARKEDEVNRQDEAKKKRDAQHRKQQESIEEGVRFRAGQIYDAARKSGALAAAEPYWEWVRENVPPDRRTELREELCAEALAARSYEGAATEYLYRERGKFPNEHWLLAKAIVERMIETGEIEPPDFVRPKLAQTA